MAPELKGAETLPSKPTDAWALGALLYLLLTGTMPCNQVGGALFDSSNKTWTSLSHQAQDLVSQLLDASPQTRLSVAGALKHPWWSVARSSQGKAARPDATAALQNTLAAMLMGR